MDGTRDRLPERMIEAWGRSYVRKPARRPEGPRNGPVRTAFAAAAPVAAPDVLIDVAPQEEPPHAAAAPAAQIERATAESPTRTRPRLGRHRAAIPVSLGAVALVAAIAAAMLLRSPVEAETAPVPAAAAGAGPVEDAALEPAASTAVVHLRVSSALAPAERQRIEAELAQAGYRTIVVHQMPFSISTSRVGYFREEDRVSAEALLAALSGTVEGLELRDYRSLVKAAEPGRLDLWIRS